MSEDGTEQLAKDALQELWKPYGGNVTDEVHGATEDNLELKDRYCAIGGGNKGINRNIGYHVKKITGRMDPFPGTRCKWKRNKLAETDSQHVVKPSG